MVRINKTRLIEIIVLIFIICSFLVLNLYIYTNNKDHEKRNNQYYFSQITLTNGRLDVNGWCFIEGVNCPSQNSRNSMAIIFEPESRNEHRITIPVSNFARKDITEKYGNGVYDYTYCGFFGGVEEKVKADHSYRILIQYDTNEPKYIYTSIYFVNGVVKIKE